MNKNFFEIQKRHEEKLREREEYAQKLATSVLRLQYLGVESVKAPYSGYNDTGCVEHLDIIFHDSHGNDIDYQYLESEDLEAIEALVALCYLALPLGWDVNYGSVGHVTFDLRIPNIIEISFEHHWIEPVKAKIDGWSFSS